MITQIKTILKKESKQSNFGQNSHLGAIKKHLTKTKGSMILPLK